MKTINHLRKKLKKILEDGKVPTRRMRRILFKRLILPKAMYRFSCKCHPNVNDNLHINGGNLT